MLILNIVLNLTLFTIGHINMLSLILTLMSWVSRLTKLNTSAQPSKVVITAKQNLGVYTKLEEGMGAFFFMFISCFQILYITYIFLSFSILFSGLSSSLEVVTFITCVLMALASIIMSTSFIFCLSDCHKSLEILGDSLTDHILDMEPGRDRQEAKVLLKVSVTDHEVFADFCVQKIERLGPLTGLGLFKIERSTVTSMVSVAVTYIIILIQFKMTVEAQ